MTNQTIARLRSPSLRSAAQSRVAQTYRPDPVRPGRVALRRNRWRTTMQMGNGTTRAYAYDANSRLTTQIELNGATRLVTIVDSYDPVGNRIGRNLDGVLTTWTYDDLYRLTHQDKPSQVCTYVLDPVGNLEVMWEASANPKTFTFDAADRLVTMVEGANLTTFTYSDFGALASEITGSQTTTYSYDGQDQLIGVLPHSGVLSTYTFDGDGMRRTAQEGNVQPTTMVWDSSDYLFLDGPSSDQLVLTLGGEIVASGTKDLLTDPLGSLVREISSGASLSSAFSFAPYGTPLSGTPTTPFRFIAAYGYYFDTSDRDYVRARELEKRLGRWMQTDPLWPFERAFGYVGGLPLYLVDPLGLGCQAKPHPCDKEPKTGQQDCSDCKKRCDKDGLGFMQLKCGPNKYECECCSPGTKKTLCKNPDGTGGTEVICQAPPSAGGGGAGGANSAACLACLQGCYKKSGWELAFCLAACYLTVCKGVVGGSPAPTFFGGGSSSGVFLFTDGQRIGIVYSIRF